MGIKAEGNIKLESTNIRVDNEPAIPLKSTPSLPNLLLRSETKDRVK